MSLPVSITGSSTSTMITANAGCGKTFTLTNRVIGWMVEHLRRTGDPGAGGVLAATFTRKAAGEILHRMLRHLARGILEPDRLAEYAPSIAVTPDPAPDELIRVLEDVVGALGRMQVGTLDGLFNRVASAFAGEVGLPDGWSIGDAPTLARLRQKALDDLLSALTDTEIEQLAVAAEADLLRGGGHDTILKSVWGKHDNGLLALWRTCVVTSPGDAAVDMAGIDFGL